MNRVRLVFSGSGGQGVITAAILLAEAAVLFENKNATQSQSYGAEARGGATRSDVIISANPVLYPKVIEPNILTCLTQTAYTKFSGIVRPGGLLLTDSRNVETTKKTDARQIELPLYDTVMEKVGKPIVYNICMLGALVGITGLVNPESVLKVLKRRLPKDFIEMNQQALNIGLDLGSQYQYKP
ncbi:MAG: 2-oxoglutarate ferredoxin oxidoreductase subunit gamma [Desulfobulbus propionicus]|nr:MAG: 2-oxoglutarate ferredoxin oxidoreductase subunit gamma [Desulfobulbus propionicus]